MSTSDDVAGLNLRAQHAVQIIHRSFRDPSLRVSGVARLVHVSPTHLSRLIKKETGVGFRDLCISLRLVEAERHLLDPTISVKEIASLVGFNSTSNFDRDFRRRHGCSPTEWRVRSIPRSSDAHIDARTKHQSIAQNVDPSRLSDKPR